MTAPTLVPAAPFPHRSDRMDVGFDIALALTTERGWPSHWRPAPHHDGMACAVIDAVMSPHVRSETVAGVVERYQRLHSPEDGPAELKRSFIVHGEKWPLVIGTRNRAWRSRSAPLKSEVIASAAELLVAEHITSRRRLLDHAHDQALRDAWSRLPGQATGATWRHLLLVAGFPKPMVCPLTRRFLRRHAPTVAGAASADDVVAIMTETARTLAVPVEDIDHQMWRAGAQGRPRSTTTTHDQPGPEPLE